MAYKQLKKPRTDIQARPGWCAEAVQLSFNVPWIGSSAADAWSRAKYKHKNSSFPNDVAVPVYFTMKGEPAGHIVVRMANGSVWSASDEDYAFDYHPNMKHLLDFYGGRLTILGWSEDLNGTRVIEKEDDMITKIIANCLRRFYTGKECTADELKRWVGKKTPDQVRNEILTFPSYKNDLASAAAGTLNPVDHLPGGLRKVYKPPAPAPAPAPTTLGREGVIKYVETNLK